MCSLHKVRIHMVNPSVFFLLALSAKRCTQQDSLWDVVDWWCLSEHSRSDWSQTSQRLGNCMNFWTPISYCGTFRDSNKPDWFGAYAFCTVVLKRLIWKTSNDKIYRVKVSLLQATEAAVRVCVCINTHSYMRIYIHTHTHIWFQCLPNVWILITTWLNPNNHTSFLILYFLPIHFTKTLPFCVLEERKNTTTKNPKSH